MRRFNEENNEEAGEHWTSRDAVRLMTTLMFPPIAGRVKAGSYLLYGGANKNLQFANLNAQGAQGFELAVLPPGAIVKLS